MDTLREIIDLLSKEEDQALRDTLNSDSWVEHGECLQRAKRFAEVLKNIREIVDNKG